jgi:hypothetical protein
MSPVASGSVPLQHSCDEFRTHKAESQFRIILQKQNDQRRIHQRPFKGATPPRRTEMQIFLSTDLFSPITEQIVNKPKSK